MPQSNGAFFIAQTCQCCKSHFVFHLSACQQMAAGIDFDNGY